jgi:hypothetical protein
MGDPLSGPSFKTPLSVRHAFDVAWNHHTKQNDHHWQYWIAVREDPQFGEAQFAIQTVGEFHDHSIAERGDGPYLDQWMAKVYLENTAHGVTSEQESANLARLRIAERAIRRANQIVALEMPEMAVREMVSDWAGAGYAQHGTWNGLRKWYMERKNKLVLHENTRCRVEFLIDMFEVSGR